MKKIFGLTLVTILGCGGDKAGTETDSGNSGGSTTEESVSSTNEPTTAASATDNSGSGGETEGASTGGGTMTDGSGGVTTGGATGGNVDIMAACQAICDLGDSCNFDVGAPCVEACLAEFAGAMGECALAIDSYLMCVANMTCMEFIDAFDNGQFGPCSQVVDAVNLACAMGVGDYGRA